MNEKRVFVLVHAEAKRRAIECVAQAAHGMTVEVKPETRSTAANRRMWAMLHDISTQVVWHGQKLTEEEWKDVFSASLKRQKVVPGIDGGFVVMGQRTSKMSRAEMSELQDLMQAFGDERSVLWSEPVVEYA